MSAEGDIHLVVTITIIRGFLAQITLMLFMGTSFLYVVVLIINLALCSHGNLGALAAIHNWTEDLGRLILITS